VDIYFGCCTYDSDSIIDSEFPGNKSGYSQSGEEFENGMNVKVNCEW
jgi:hypothetical protein